MIMGFPDKKDDIIDWIKSNFSGQIIVLDRVKTNLSRYSQPLDIKQLCSAIVYLNAYVLYRRNQLTEEELEFYRIGKPWEIDHVVL